MLGSGLRNMFTTNNTDVNTANQEQIAIPNTASFQLRPGHPSTSSSYISSLNEESFEGQFNKDGQGRQQITMLTTPDNHQEQNRILHSFSFESTPSHSTYHQSGGDCASNLQNYASYLLPPQASSTADFVSDMSSLWCTSHHNPGSSNTVFFNQETIGKGSVHSLKKPFQEEGHFGSNRTAGNYQHNQSGGDRTTNTQNYEDSLMENLQFTSTPDFGSWPNDSPSINCVSSSHEEGHSTSNMASYNYQHYQSGKDLTTNLQNYNGLLIETPQFLSTLDDVSVPSDFTNLSSLGCTSQYDSNPSITSFHSQEACRNNFVHSSRRMFEEEGNFASNIASNYNHYPSRKDLPANLQNYQGSPIGSLLFPSSADHEYQQNDLTHSSSFSYVSPLQEEGKFPSTMTGWNYKHQSGRTLATNAQNFKDPFSGAPQSSSTVDPESGRTDSSNSSCVLNEGSLNLNHTNMNAWKKHTTPLQGGTSLGFNADNHDKHSFTHQKCVNLLNSMQNYGHCDVQTSGLNSTSDMNHIIPPSLQSFPINNSSNYLDDRHTNHESFQDSFPENNIEDIKNLSDNKEVLFVCSVCQMDFRFKSWWECHSRTHKTKIEDQNPFKCDQCTRRFFDKTSLKDHTLIHGAKAEIHCEFCQKGFMTKSKLKKHLRVHATTSEAKYPFKCDLCPERFTNKDYLYEHSIVHGAEAKFHCNICSKGFMTNYYLKAHLNDHSTNIEAKSRPFKCDECTQQFTSENRLITHTLVHGAKAEFICNWCQKSFMFRSELKCHILDVHKTRPDSIILFQ